MGKPYSGSVVGTWRTLPGPRAPILPELRHRVAQVATLATGGRHGPGTGCRQVGTGAINPRATSAIGGAGARGNRREVGCRAACTECRRGAQGRRDDRINPCVATMLGGVAAARYFRDRYRDSASPSGDRSAAGIRLQSRGPARPVVVRAQARAFGVPMGEDEGVTRGALDASRDVVVSAFKESGARDGDRISHGSSVTDLSMRKSNACLGSRAG